MARTFIYFIGPESGYIKIGKAKNVKHRLAALQTSHPETLKLFGVMLCDERVERALHRRFSHLAVRGEWFTRAPEIDQYIAENTMCDEAAVYIKLNEAEELDRLKKEYADEIGKRKKERERAAREEVFARFKNRLAADLTEFWVEQLNILKRMDHTLESLNEQIKVTGQIIDSNMVFKDMRTSVRRFFDTDWRKAQHALQLVFEGENWKANRALAFDAEIYVKKNAWVWVEAEKDPNGPHRYSKAGG